jgi:hypothetical protein
MSREPILSGSSLFTISRYDIYDHQRCPKIVSIKVYRRIRTPKPEKEPNEKSENTTALIGRVGEAVTRVAFSPRVSAGQLGSMAEKVPTQSLVESIAHLGVTQGPFEKAELAELQSQIQQLPKNMEDELKNVMRDTLVGLEAIRGDVTSAYGSLTVIGHGESRYGILPTMGYPDFVAQTKQGKPILIEVKNSAKENVRLDGFQAAFYNSLGKTVGVVVQHATLTNGVLASEPRIMLEEDAESFLIYPRLAKWRKVSETAKLDADVVKDVWKAKQLGVLGKSPETGCRRDCPHHRYKIELPEGNLEVAKPLPLIFARGGMELGLDFDYHNVRSYLWQVAPSLSRLLWEAQYRGDRVSIPLREKLRQILREKFGVEESVVMKLVPESSMYPGSERPPSVEEVTKEEADEMEQWEKLLPEKILKGVLPSAQGYGTRIYGLPKGSKELIRKTWHKW